MPREIDCPGCVIKYGRLLHRCRTCNCTGKIKVYTEQELQEKLGYVEGLFTPEELQEAIKQEREECALICDNYIMPSQFTTIGDVLEYCAEAIRARSAKG